MLTLVRRPGLISAAANVKRRSTFIVSALKRKATNMADCRLEPLCFNSRSKSPFHKLSNFYEVEIEMSEGRFGSVEHYFQAMKFSDEDHCRFEVDGDLGTREKQGGAWKPGVPKGRFIKSVGSKKGTAEHGLRLREDGLDRERAKRKMKEGLLRKFEKETFRSLLFESGERPLVHIPMRGKTDYWTGRVNKDTGNIEGENNMGKLLMEVREDLLKKAGKDEEKKLREGVSEEGGAGEESVEQERIIEDVGEGKDEDEHRGKKRKRDERSVGKVVQVQSAGEGGGEKQSEIKRQKVE